MLKLDYRMQMTNVWEILERKHAITVLVAIYENPGITQAQLIDGTPGRSTKFDRIKELYHAGLITVKISEEHWSARDMYTTPEGSRLARNLINAREGRDVPDQTNHGTSAEQVDSVKL